MTRSREYPAPLQANRQAPLLLTSLLAALIAALSCNNPASQPGQRQGAAADAGPRRIVSLSVLSDEVLYDLGAETRRRVVAISGLADDPRYSRVAGLWPPAVKRQRTRLEDILWLKADLVIAAPFTSTEVVTALRSARINVVMLDGFAGFEDFRGNVRRIAAAAHVQKRGDEIVAQFDARLRKLRRPIEPAAKTIISSFSGMVAGTNTTFDDVIGVCGLRSAATHKGFRRVSGEQIAVWDADFIVVPEDGAEEQAGLKASRAFKTGSMIPTPVRLLTSSGSEMLSLAEHLCRRTLSAVAADPASPGHQ